MLGANSQNCENNCQCSGLITDAFRINSGNSSTKRKQEEAAASNFKLKMHPASLDFKSPTHTPPKRRILGEIQNCSSFSDNVKTTIVSRACKSPLCFSNENSIIPKNSPIIDKIMTPLKKSPLLENSSPLTTRSSFSLRRTKSSFTHMSKSSTKISRIFEERSQFRMSNICETFMKIDVEEETQDCSFAESFTRETSENWSTTKLDFTDALQSTSFTKPEDQVPEKEAFDLDPDHETLHDLEEEFENDNFDQCTKYEIISTDSPDIISRGRSTARKVESRNFTFGAPLSDSENSTSFNKPTISATRSLNFEDQTFQFTSPVVKRPQAVKKSLKFSETPTKLTFKLADKFDTPKKCEETSKKFEETRKFEETPKKYPLRHDKSDSSVSSFASYASSPSCSQTRLFTSESTASMESGFVSEFEEPFLGLEDNSTPPKVPNFNELISGEIKENFLNEKLTHLKRPSLLRSLSLNQEPKAKISLFSIKEKESPEKRSQKREVPDVEIGSVKRRKSNCNSPERILKENRPRPVLQRAFSENHASIMSAVARSSEESDLIGDFSGPCALPLVRGEQTDLRCVSADTLAALIRGDYSHTVHSFQVIDCRYPYEFEGGHIPGAVNLYTPDLVRRLLDTPPREGRNILVFHCEFSLERGPKLYRFLRSTDRTKNSEHYPNLTFPEMYLLHKGYSSFYKNYPELCSNGYTMMLDPKHSQLLRKHRSSEEPASFFTHHRSKPGNRLMF